MAQKLKLKWYKRRRGPFYYFVLADKIRIYYTSGNYKTVKAALKGIATFKQSVMEAGLDDSWGDVPDE